jgi:hypothetical protein
LGVHRPAVAEISKEARRPAVVRRWDESGLQPRAAFHVERPGELAPVERVVRAVSVLSAEHQPDAERPAQWPLEQPLPVGPAQEPLVVPVPRPELLGEWALQASELQLQGRLPVEQAERRLAPRVALPRDAA